MRARGAGPLSADAVVYVDALLFEMEEEAPDGVSLSRLIQELESKADVYEDGAEVAGWAADELRRRVRAGVRFWPTGENACEAIVEHIERELAQGNGNVARARNTAPRAKLIAGPEPSPTTLIGLPKPSAPESGELFQSTGTASV